MERELKNKLKETGFQFKNKECSNCTESHVMCDEWAYKPSLSELIEACGDNFKYLCRHSKRWLPSRGKWSVRWRDHNGKVQYPKWGHTPEEAVAKLWLALNE